MSTLYLTEQGALVTKTGGRLLIRKDGKTLHDLPAIHVEQIVVFGNVHFTTPAIKFVLERGIDVAYLSSYGKYRGRLQHAFAKDATLRQAQYQKAGDPSFCLTFARGLIGGKLQNTLAFTQRQRQRHAEVEASVALMHHMLRQLSTANTLDILRGYEGAASAAYYRALRTFLKADMGFQARIRHPPTDPVNVLLLSVACKT